MTATRVLVVDDDPAHAQVLANCLAQAGDDPESYDVVEARHADEARALLSKSSIDLVFVDYRLGAVSGLDLVRVIRDSGDRRPIIVTTAHGDEYLAVEMIRAGADDYLSKFDLSPQRVRAAIEQVFARRCRDADADAEREAASRNLLTLTKREREVLDLIVSGLMNREIADKLHRSEKTVKIHRANIMQKMGASTAADLARLVVSARLGATAGEPAENDADNAAV